MIINNDELVGYLRQILSQEPLDEDALSDWANEWLFSTDDSVNEYAEELHRQEQLQVSLLKPLVGSYRHNPALPALPTRRTASFTASGLFTTKTVTTECW